MFFAFWVLAVAASSSLLLAARMAFVSPTLHWPLLLSGWSSLPLLVARCELMVRDWVDDRSRCPQASPQGHLVQHRRRCEGYTPDHRLSAELHLTLWRVLYAYTLKRKS